MFRLNELWKLEEKAEGAKYFEIMVLKLRDDK